jgi:hypothetical protein
MNAMRRPGAAMSPRPKMEYGFAAFALNCGKISFIGPSKAEEVATCKMGHFNKHLKLLNISKDRISYIYLHF